VRFPRKGKRACEAGGCMHEAVLVFEWIAEGRPAPDVKEACRWLVAADIRRMAGKVQRAGAARERAVVMFLYNGKVRPEADEDGFMGDGTTPGRARQGIVVRGKPAAVRLAPKPSPAPQPKPEEV
jgi:hypothetical protein